MTKMSSRTVFLRRQRNAPPPLVLLFIIFSAISHGDEGAHNGLPHGSSRTEIKSACLISNYDHSGFVRGFDLSGWHPTYNTLAVPSITPFWAQEFSGLDIVARELRAVSRSVGVGVIDAGFDLRHLPGEAMSQELREQPLISSSRYDQTEHGSAVVSLIAGREPVGGSPASKIEFAWIHSPDVLEQAEAVKKLQRVKIVNLSMAINEANLPILQKISEHSILVTAAGNDYFRDIGLKSNVSAIIVGSSNIYGFMSDFSQLGDSVDILAPSDTYVQTSWEKGWYEGFGGTSGATPAVTAALANAIHFLPFLNLKQSRSLLKLTATPTVLGKATPGILNAVRLVEAARRLAKVCTDGDCLDKYLAPSDDKQRQDATLLFDMSSLAKDVETEAQTQLKSDQCNNQRDGFRLLRKAFLLDPTESRRQQLEKYYTQMNVGNAIFYETLQKDGLKHLLENKIDLRKMYSLATPSSQVHIERAILRAKVISSEKPTGMVLDEEYTRQSAQGVSGPRMIATVELAGHYADALARSRNQKDVEKVEQAQSKAEKLIVKAMSSSDPDLQIAALNQASAFTLSISPEVLQLGIASSQPKVRMTAYHGVVQRGGLDATEKLVEAMKDEDARLRRISIRWAETLLKAVTGNDKSRYFQRNNIGLLEHALKSAFNDSDEDVANESRRVHGENRDVFTKPFVKPKYSTPSPF